MDKKQSCKSRSGAMSINELKSRILFHIAAACLLLVLCTGFYKFSLAYAGPVYKDYSDFDGRYQGRNGTTSYNSIVKENRTYESTTKGPRHRDDTKVLKKHWSIGATAQNTATLISALKSNDIVIVAPGIYNPLEISFSNKTLIMRQGVIFKIQDNTVTAIDIKATPVLLLSGDNISIYGAFTIDGNRVKNDISSIPTSAREGSLHISGSNCHIFGHVTILNAYYIGLSIGNGDNSGDEVPGTYINDVTIDNPNYYACLIWTCEDFFINSIRVIAGSPGFDRDQRVRFGTGKSVSGKCQRGRVGSILTGDTVIIEARTENVSFGTIIAKRACKFEDCSKNDVQSIHINDASEQNESYGFMLNSVSDINIGKVIVQNYNSAAKFAGYASVINGAENCSIDSLIIIGTISNEPDCVIRSANYLHIKSMVCKDPIGAGIGFLYDYDSAYAPQQDIVIDTIVSHGHKRNNITIESEKGIVIGKMK